MVCMPFNAALPLCWMLLPTHKANQRLWHSHIFPTNVPFPHVKVVDFLKQAATDIITILTSPPSTTTPSLEAGDPVRNALLTLATQLHRIDTIPEPVKMDSPTPRVLSPELQRKKLLYNKSEKLLYNNSHSKLQRVDTPVPSLSPSPVSDTIPASALQIPSTELKNARFRNTVPHSYPLSSLKNRQQNLGTNYKNL